MALTKQQIMENLKAIEAQGGTDADIQDYLDSISPKSAPKATQSAPVQAGFQMKASKNPLVNAAAGAGATLLDKGYGLGEAILRFSDKSAKLFSDVADLAAEKVTGKKVDESMKYGNSSYTSKLADTLGQLNAATQAAVQPAKETVAGQIGSTAAQIGAYASGSRAFEPVAGALGLAGRTALRTVPDAINALADTKGNVAQALPTIAASALGNAVFPGAGAVAKPGKTQAVGRFLRDVLPGYLSDVTYGMTGDRGEDRTGANAFIPGMGTALGAGFATATRAPAAVRGLEDTFTAATGIGADAPRFGTEASKARVKQAKDIKIESKRAKGLSELNNKYKNLKEIEDKANNANIPLKKILSETDILADSIDNNGRVNTYEARKQFKQMLEPYENAVGDKIAEEGKSISTGLARKEWIKKIKESGLTGSRLTKALGLVDSELAGTALKTGNGEIVPVLELHKMKVDRGLATNYADTEAAHVDKVVTKALKEIVESSTDSVDVKAINRKLQELYTVDDYLEALQGKIPESGKMGKYFARTLGGMAGSKLGPIGTVMGAVIGDAVQTNLSKVPFSGTTGKNLEVPQELKDAIVPAVPKQLRAPASDAPADVMKQFEDSFAGYHEDAPEYLRKARAELKNAKNQPPQRSFDDTLQGGYVANPFARLFGGDVPEAPKAASNMANKIAPAVTILNPAVDTIVSTHFATARMIADDAAQNGINISLKTLLDNTKSEVLAALKPSSSGATANISDDMLKKIVPAIEAIKFSPSKIQTLDDIAKAISEAVNMALVPSMAKVPTHVRGGFQDEVNEILKDMRKLGL